MSPAAFVRPAASRLGLLIAALVAFAGVGATPAAAFDSGPHGDITIDAMQAEGFGFNAARVAQLSNYFVDFYSQSKNDPYSGYAKAKIVAASQPIDPREYEMWPEAVRNAANTSHFDETDRPGRFSNPADVAAEWSRLRRATYLQLQRAKSDQNEVAVLELIGMSLPNSRTSTPTPTGSSPAASARSAGRAGIRRSRVRLRPGSTFPPAGGATSTPGAPAGALTVPGMRTKTVRWSAESIRTGQLARTIPRRS